MDEKNGFQIGIFLVCCIAAILSGATLYLVAVQGQNKASPTDFTGERESTAAEPDQIHERVCKHTDDVAIIGAGIAGSYAAWRLRRANISVTLYEYSNRIGGRCHTVHFPGIPDINIELGAMRFYPTSHVMLNETIRELGLETMVHLPENDKSMYHLRGKRLTYKDLMETPPYNLKPEHRKSTWQLQWEIFDNFTNVNSSVKGYMDPPLILKYKTPDGVPLYQQSAKSFYGKYLYPELAAFLEDIWGYSGSFQGGSASKVVPISDPSLPLGPGSRGLTVKRGFQAVPETMVHQFLEANRSHKFKRNHHLKAIRKLKNGHYKVIFRPTETLRGVTKDMTGDSVHQCAKQILLAIPRLALENLDWNVLKDPVTEDYIKNSLYETKAAKMFFAYDDPWWQNVPNFAPVVYSDTPLRITNNFGVSNATRKAVLNPVYNDVYTEVWRNTLQQGKPVPGINGDESMQTTEITENMARKFLAQIYGISESNVPQPNCSIMRIWDDYPFGASWYRFRPGYLWDEVADHMMKPSRDDNIFIISNTFSRFDKHSWVEGALEIVESVLQKYFPQFYNL